MSKYVTITTDVEVDVRDVLGTLFEEELIEYINRRNDNLMVCDISSPMDMNITKLSNKINENYDMLKKLLCDIVGLGHHYSNEEMISKLFQYGILK